MDGLAERQCRPLVLVVVVVFEVFDSKLVYQLACFYEGDDRDR
jgi:hypothetical protein